MAYKTRDNTGALFSNRHKDTDKHPDDTGKCKIDGKWYWISSWNKETEAGYKFTNTTYKPFTEEQAKKQEQKEEGLEYYKPKSNGDQAQQKRSEPQQPQQPQNNNAAEDLPF